MEKIVWCMIFTFVIFAVIVVICNVNTIQVQDSLINMFMGTIATELATMGGIQIFKVKHPKNIKDGEQNNESNN